MNKKHEVKFSTITKEDWNKFSSVCRANGETITKVLWRAAQEYVEKHKKEGK
uniref:Uncharacterized protein n=1 Tax=viral metagenome TaxID=1070528 RepID=A0A6M3J077_9ZZZZ